MRLHASTRRWGRSPAPSLRSSTSMRSRALRFPTRGPYVLVDAASARLYMIEDGRVRDSMKVIVGKPETPTPELKSVINYETLNPYWHVTADLAKTLIAPRVLQDGDAYLTDRGYEVLSAFGPDARVLSPDSVDWKAVAAGKTQVYVRQRPGPANSLGRFKFDLPDGDGIYLHDTPKKELFAQDSATSATAASASRMRRGWRAGSSARTRPRPPRPRSISSSRAPCRSPSATSTPAARCSSRRCGTYAKKPRKRRRALLDTDRQVQAFSASASTVWLRRELLRSAADVDLPRLHRLGDLAHQLDREQPVLQVRAPDLDMVGKREAALERAVGDPAIDEVAALLVALVRLAARDQQHVLLGGDVDLVAA